MKKVLCFLLTMSCLAMQAQSVDYELLGLSVTLWLGMTLGGGYSMT